MSRLFNTFKIINQRNKVGMRLINYVPQRGARFETNITWKEPPRYQHYDPIRSGDRSQLSVKNPLIIHSDFQDSEELKTADEKVKKIFSLGYMKPKFVYSHYHQELLNKVKDHPFDMSTSMKIAALTAKIRYYQSQINEKPTKRGIYRRLINEYIAKRRVKLLKLRTEDYKKFEWLLETLDLELRVANFTNTNGRIINRKGALMLLAQLKAERIKEEKLAEIKRKFDEEKVKFIEDKIAKLKLIKEMETRVGVPPTVSEEDIQKCTEHLGKVKIDVAKRAKLGYKRKIHPYFIEPYHETLLKENEKRGQKIMTELDSKQRNEPVVDTADSK